MGHLNKRLQILGIKTAWDLREADAKRLRSKFSVNMERTVLELRGISCLEMNDLHEPRKRIMTSRSFGRPTPLLHDLQGAIRQHAQRGAEKLHFIRRETHRQKFTLLLTIVSKKYLTCE